MRALEDENSGDDRLDDRATGRGGLRRVGKRANALLCPLITLPAFGSRLTFAVVLIGGLTVSACGGKETTGPTPPPAVASVVITPSTATLVSLGETVQLSASARDASGNAISGKTFSWSSSDEEVATVASTGLATAVCDGAATITATTDGVSGSAPLTVVQPQTNFWMRSCLAITAVGWVAVNPANGNIFANNRSDGVFRSVDGVHWTAANTGLANLDVRNVAINSAGTLFAAKIDGVFRSTDNGDSWALTGFTDEADLIRINPSGHLFVGTEFDGIFRSTDDGVTWVSASAGFPVSRQVFDIATNPSTGDMFTSSFAGTFRSTDNGDSWTNISATAFAGFVFNASGDIFAGTLAGDGVFRSTDAGATWQAVNTGLTDLALRSLAINSAGDLFTGTATGGVFRSTDDGGSWSPVNTGLTNLPMGRPLAVDLTGRLFAGTEDGPLFRSVDST